MLVYMPRSMSMLLSKYFYPLESPIPLSAKLGVSLDNPRTPEEIDDFAQLLAGNFVTDGPRADIYDLAGAIRATLHALGEDDSDSSRIASFIQYNDIFRSLAAIAVVIRYALPDPPHDAKLMLPRQTTPEQEAATRDYYLRDPLSYESIARRGPSWVAHQRAVGYVTLLSLLLDPPAHSPYNSLLFSTSPGTRVDWIALMVHLEEPPPNSPHSQREYPYNWYALPTILDQLTMLASEIEPALNDSRAASLDYIMNVMFLLAEDHLDRRVRLLLFSSLIEMLLTHNPNFQRFNVEDSISRQFRLKLALLSHDPQSGVPIETLARRFRDIYSQRSNLAHGNFKDVAGDHDLDSMVNSLQIALSVTLRRYLVDPTFIAFLKEG
jgi:hypothetical protein